MCVCVCLGIFSVSPCVYVNLFHKCVCVSSFSENGVCVSDFGVVCLCFG